MDLKSELKWYRLMFPNQLQQQNYMQSMSSLIINNTGSKITLAEAMTRSKSGELMEEETDERSNIKGYEVATCISD